MSGRTGQVPGPRQDERSVHAVHFLRFPAAAGHTRGRRGAGACTSQNCLRLKEVDLYGIDDEEHVQRMVDEMVLAAASSMTGLPYWFVVSTPQIPPLHRPPTHQPTRKALLLLRLTVFDASDIGTFRQLIRALLAKDCAN